MVMVKKKLLSIASKIVLKEKAGNKYRNLSEEEKEAKRDYSRNSTKGQKQAKFCLL